MPVDQSAYRSWDGKARPTRTAALAMASVLVGRYYKVKLVRWLANVVIGGSCVLAPIFLYARHQVDNDIAMKAAMQQFGFDRLNVLEFVNRQFHLSASLFAVLLVGVVAAPLIAEDRRAKALALYFSRPIRHIDYLLGKLLTGLVFVGGLLLLPPILMYLAELGFSDAKGVAGDQLPVLLRSLLAGAVLGTMLVSVALGISACTDRTNYASLLFLGAMALTWGVAMMLATEIFRDARWLAVSPVLSAHRIIHDLLPTAGRMSRVARVVAQMDLHVAWLTVLGWTAAGLGLLLLRVRRVEVVS